ncbi:MAG: carboxypeptidase-like regulatory domain-containing protein [Longimonas sp.]|uniref:carboxypeptidase-like regulatory domain-containing protein n=1 Tax=Longimonas sp. TaxID=2039626 RepID=UPI00334CF4AE
MVRPGHAFPIPINDTPHVRSAVLVVLFSLCMGLLLDAAPARAQSGTGVLEGVIQDTEGERLPGATVQLTGTDLGAAADAQGAFRLAGIPAGMYQVRVRFVGYVPLEDEVTIEAGATTSRTFALEMRTVALEDVIVSAQKRLQAVEDVPAAISVVDGQTLADLEIEEFDSFSAYVPGLEIQLQSPNNPGFVVRGITSDSGDSRIEPRVSVF